jgi:hypothetical protein
MGHCITDRGGTDRLIHTLPIVSAAAGDPHHRSGGSAWDLVFVRQGRKFMSFRGASWRAVAEARGIRVLIDLAI